MTHTCRSRSRASARPSGNLKQSLRSNNEHASHLDALQGRGKQRRSNSGAHERTDISPSGRARSQEEEEAVINAIKDENIKLNAMK